MSPHITCLFLGGGKRYWMAEHFHKVARKLNLHFHLVTYDLSEYVHIAGLAEVIAGKRFTEWTVDDLRDAIYKSGADLIVPFMDTALPVLTEHLGGDRDVTDRFYDKVKTKKWATEIGITVPPAQGYPYIIKPRYGWGSRDIHIVRKRKDWPITFSYDKYMVEHYLEGSEEISVDCYVTKDSTVYAYPRLRLLVSRGEVENSVTIDDPEVAALATKVVSDLRGPVNVQFLKRDGNYYLIDVNPRFGGGCPLTIYAGADYVEMMLREHIGLPVQEVDWKPNVLMIRAAREIFFENYTNSA